MLPSALITVAFYSEGFQQVTQLSNRKDRLSVLYFGAMNQNDLNVQVNV